MYQVKIVIFVLNYLTVLVYVLKQLFTSVSVASRGYFLIILFACLTHWLNQKGGLGAEPLKKNA